MKDISAAYFRLQSYFTHIGKKPLLVTYFFIWCVIFRGLLLLMKFKKEDIKEYSINQHCWTYKYKHLWKLTRKLMNYQPIEHLEKVPQNNGKSKINVTCLEK